MANTPTAQPKPLAVSQLAAENKRTLLQAMAWAETQYHQCLLESPEADAARRYLNERGITAESIERFQPRLLTARTRLDSAKRPGERDKPKPLNAGRRFSKPSAS